MAKAKNPFSMQPPTKVDKYFDIWGPDIHLKVDYDDVDQTTVLQQAKQIVKLLNEHWQESTVAIAAKCRCVTAGSDGTTDHHGDYTTFVDRQYDWHEVQSCANHFENYARSPWWEAK
jgi:hypothetical protein